MNKQETDSNRQNESGKTTSKSSVETASKSTDKTKGIQSSQLLKLFEDELKDIYWVEKTLTKAIPKMIKNATSPDLADALENHLSQTKQQVGRIEQVFEVLGKKPSAKTCKAMEGILEEAEEIMEECEEGAMCDAGIISAAQKVEHYEIATYGTLKQFAETLGLNDAVDLLEATLEEEKAADEKLTSIATMEVNLEAAGEEVREK